MAKKPLELNWNHLLYSDDAPPQELVVVATPDVEREAPVAELSDHELSEKKKSLLSMITTGVADKLPDKGANLRQKIQQLQSEQDCRKLAQFRKEDEERKSRSQEVVIHDVPSPNFTKSEPRQNSSFTSIFSSKLDGSSSQDRCGSAREDIENKHGGTTLQAAKVPAKQYSFRCTSMASRGTCNYSNGNWRNIGSSKTPSSHAGKSVLCCSPRKKRALACGDSLPQRPKMVPHVVLSDDPYNVSQVPHVVLSDEEEVLDEEEVHSELIHFDANDEWKEVKLYYPSRNDRECIELSYADMKCLNPGEYLSSPIMNFYIRYLQKQLSSSGKTSGCHFFNTFFFKKLEEDMSCTGDQGTDFLKLRRWWKDVNLFQKSYIFLPIHKEWHWSLVIICILSKEHESGPVILHLDSLGIHQSGEILSVVNRFLELEWDCISQNGPSPDVPVTPTIWRDFPRRTRKKTLVVPQQKNEYDCGFFVLYFMERFITEAPERLEMKNLSKFGKKWFKPEEASGLRKRIRDLLLEEFESARLGENVKPESPASSSTSSVDTDEFDTPF